MAWRSAPVPRQSGWGSRQQIQQKRPLCRFEILEEIIDVRDIGERGADLFDATRPAGSIRAEIYGKGGAGSDRGCLVLWPAQKVGAVLGDAGVRERPDVGEVGGVDLGTAGAHAPRDNLGPGGLSVN